MRKHTAWGGELQGTEANIVESFVIKNHTLVGVLNQLMDRERCVVRLDDSIRNFRRWEDGERKHHSIRVFLSDLGNQKSSHSRSSPSSQRMAHLKPYESDPRHLEQQNTNKNTHKKRKKKNSRLTKGTLKAVAVLGLLPNHIKNGIDKLCAFGVMALSPVVSGTGLAENEVIRPENLTVRSRSDAVHDTRLKIHKHGTRNKSPATRLIVVDIDPVKLQIRIASVLTDGVDAVLGTDDLPELGADLVATLASLDVKDLTHFHKK